MCVCVCACVVPSCIWSSVLYLLPVEALTSYIFCTRACTFFYCRQINLQIYIGDTFLVILHITI